MHLCHSLHFVHINILCVDKWILYSERQQKCMTVCTETHNSLARKCKSIHLFPHLRYCLFRCKKGISIRNKIYLFFSDNPKKEQMNRIKEASILEARIIIAAKIWTVLIRAVIFNAAAGKTWSKLGYRVKTNRNCGVGIEPPSGRFFRWQGW